MYICESVVLQYAMVSTISEGCAKEVCHTMSCGLDKDVSDHLEDVPDMRRLHSVQLQCGTVWFRLITNSMITFCAANWVHCSDVT